MFEVIGGIIGGLESLFGGSVDKGAWQGGVFVPGDLAKRQAQASADLQANGVAGISDPNRINQILYTESGWQNALGSYIAELREQKKSNIGLGVTNELNKIPQLLGITIPPIIWMLLAGLVGFYFLIYKKKRF